MSLSQGFFRSRLKDDDEVAKLIAKVAFLQAKKPNAFNVDFKGQKMTGDKMTNVDLDGDPTKITFTFDGADYELALSDIKIVKRLRTKKYMFKTNVLTDVTPP